MVTKPKVITQASRRRSICMRLNTSKSGGTTIGMKAMWIGMMFWLMMLISKSAPISPHFRPFTLEGIWSRLALPPILRTTMPAS